METKQKTIGQRIDEEVSKYISVYRTLKECGNKQPAKVTLSEAWLNVEYVAERVMRRLTELYEEEAEKEGKEEGDAE